MALAIAAIVVMAVFLYKKGQNYRVRKSTSDSIIEPVLQRRNTLEGGRSRPCDLQLESQTSPSSSYLPTYSSTPSSQRPLLPPEQGPPGSLPPPSYRRATSQTNGHTLPHQQVAINGTRHNTYIAEPSTQLSLSSRASNRDSQLTLPGIENSPEDHL